VSHLIYNKILINFLKEKKLKIKIKFKKKKNWGGWQTHRGWPAAQLSLGVALATPDRPAWGGRTTPNHPQGQKKIKIKFF
jgi:hypothetical protein